jgi:hypothetical protein
LTGRTGKSVDRGMSKTPDTTKRAETERLARQAREAAALRENLRKRKEQARARDPQASQGSSQKKETP